MALEGWHSADAGRSGSAEASQRPRGAAAVRAALRLSEQEAAGAGQQSREWWVALW